MKLGASEELKQSAGHTSALFTDTTVRTGHDREQNENRRRRK